MISLVTGDLYRQAACPGGPVRISDLNCIAVAARVCVIEIGEKGCVMVADGCWAVGREKSVTSQTYAVC